MGTGALMTTREVADYFGVSPKEVRRLHEEGHLGHARGFRCPYKFARKVVEAYLNNGIENKK